MIDPDHEKYLQYGKSKFPFSDASKAHEKAVNEVLREKVLKVAKMTGTDLRLIAIEDDKKRPDQK